MGLGPHHGPNARPSCRCAAGQGRRHLPLASQAPLRRACHAVPLRGTRSRTGWTPVSSTDHALARPLCSRGRGILPPDALGSVGAATRLAAAYGPRLPEPGSSRWGGSVAGCCAPPGACPAAMRRLGPAWRPRNIKVGATPAVEERAKHPAATERRAKRETRALRRVAQLEARRGRV